MPAGNLSRSIILTISETNKLLPSLLAFSILWSLLQGHPKALLLQETTEYHIVSFCLQRLQPKVFPQEWVVKVRLAWPQSWGQGFGRRVTWFLENSFCNWYTHDHLCCLILRLSTCLYEDMFVKTWLNNAVHECLCLETDILVSYLLSSHLTCGLKGLRPLLHGVWDWEFD